MVWVMDTYSMHVGHTVTSIVTGKPLEMGGFQGHREATGTRPDDCRVRGGDVYRC